jgi:hypothetical protein
MKNTKLIMTKPTNLKLFCVLPNLREVDVVVNTCGPSYLGCGGRRIMVRNMPRQKHKTLLEKQTKSKVTGVEHKYEFLSSISSASK